MRSFYYLILFIILGTALYFPIFSVGFIGDDVPQLVKFKYFHNLDAVTDIFFKVIATPTGHHNSLLGFFYRPLTFSVYTLLYYYTQANPFYFHVLQFSLFITATYLLFLFFKTFYSTRLSLGLAAVFLIHPANAELVAYIAALADTMCLLFGIAAFNIMARTKRSSLLVVILVCALLLLSLLAKEAGILFVILAGIYAINIKKLKSYWLPLIITVGVYSVCRINAAQHILFTTLSNPMGNLSLLERILQAPQFAYALIRELIIPTRIALKPGMFHADFTFSIFPLIMLCFFVFVAVVLWILIKKYNKKSVSTYLFFLCWIFVGILLYVHIIPLEVLFADRWLYVAEIGLLGAIAIILKTFPLNRNKWLRLCGVLIGIVVLLYAVETMVINFKWAEWH